MSNFTVDQFVYNIPSASLVMHGSVKLLDTSRIDRQFQTTCLSSPTNMQLVFSQDVASLFIFDETEIILSINLICPDQQEGASGAVEYDTEQLFTVNADHPLIRQIIPVTDIETLPPSITVRLPTQKVVKVRAEALTYSKCLDYFDCNDYVLELNFPQITFTSQFKYTVEFKTTRSVDNEQFCNNLQVLRANCGGSCFTSFNFSDLGQRVTLTNRQSSLSCNQFIICFYPYNRIATQRGYTRVCNITNGDYLVSLDKKRYKVNRIFKLPIYHVTDFVKFPTDSVKTGMPSKTCYLTPEHMVQTELGTLNAEQYARKFRESHGIEKIQLYTEHIYSFEVASHERNIYVDYEGLPARVWNLDEKQELKIRGDFVPP